MILIFSIKVVIGQSNRLNPVKLICLIVVLTSLTSLLTNVFFFFLLLEQTVSLNLNDRSANNLEK